MKFPLARIVFVTLLFPGLVSAGLPMPSLVLPTDAPPQGAANVKLASPAVGAEMVNGSAPIQEMIQRFKPVEFDLLLRAKELGAGVEPSFQFVQDHIRYESYPGVLRGSKGAYLTKAANAVDRAMLLAELLKAKGVTTRFARGRLPAANAETLFNRMFERPAVSAPANKDAMTPSAMGVEFANRIQARARRDYATIIASLGPNIPAAVTPTRADVLAEITTHTWLQARVGEVWVDLDSSFVDAIPGKRYCEADEVFDALPDQAHQRVTIRVVVEKLDGGSLRQETALEMSRAVDSLLDLQIFLVHIPSSSFKALGQAIGGGKGEQSPALWIDGAFTFGKPIAFDEQGAPAASVGRGGALGDALDALGGGGDAKDAAPQFIAEFLEFTVTFPDGRTETTRRALCDRGGAAWHSTRPLDPKALRPLARDGQTVTDAQTVHNIWFSAGRHDLAAYAAGVQLLINAYAKPAEQAASDFGGDVWPIALQNFACVLWGDQAFVPALNDDPNLRFYVDSPRILMFSSNARPTAGKPDKLDVDSVIDLRRDKVRGVSKDPGNPMAIARRKMWYGVLEGALEHETAAQASAAGNADNRSVMSTSEFFTGSSAIALRASEPVASQPKIKFEKDAAARLAVAQAEGDTVIAPIDRPGDNVGWWAIAAGTGDTRAVWGQDINASVYKDGGRAGGGSGNPAAGNRVDPATGKGMSRRKGSGGNEYGTVVKEVSLPGVGMVRQSVLIGVVVAVASAAAAIIGAVASAQ